MANGEKAAQTARKKGICELSYCRWWKEFGGLKLGQPKRLKEPQKANARLKRLVAELFLDKQALRGVGQGNF